MKPDRFMQIMRFIHEADNNNLDKNDKMTKLRPLIKKLKEKFLHHIPKEQNINYDKARLNTLEKMGANNAFITN